MTETIANLQNYGYLILFVYSLGGGMVGILAAGVLSFLSQNSGAFDLRVCIALAFVANTLGSTLLFVLGRYYKRELMPHFRRHRRKLALAQLKMRQHGTSLIIVQKFIYGLKTFIPIAAGFARFPLLRFIVLNTLATALWAIVLGYIGFAFGHIIVPAFDKIAEFPYLVPLFLLVLIALIYLYLSRFSRKSRAIS